jgi:hypothetical protein
VESRLLRARIRWTSGNAAGALADLERLGSHGGALQFRARILAQQRRFPEAQACLAQLPDGRDAEVAGLRGAVALGLGDVAAAVTELRRSLALGGSHEAARNLSTALEAHGMRRGLTAAAERCASARRCGGPGALRQLAGSGSAPGPGRTSRPHALSTSREHPVRRPHPAARPRGTESAIAHLAGTARRGHRVVS